MIWSKSALIQKLFVKINIQSISGRCVLSTSHTTWDHMSFSVFYLLLFLLFLLLLKLLILNSIEWSQNNVFHPKYLLSNQLHNNRKSPPRPKNLSSKPLFPINFGRKIKLLCVCWSCFYSINWWYHSDCDVEWRVDQQSVI